MKMCQKMECDTGGTHRSKTGCSAGSATFTEQRAELQRGLGCRGWQRAAPAPGTSCSQTALRVVDHTHTHAHTHSR